MEPVVWTLRGAAAGAFVVVVIARAAERLRLRNAFEQWVALVLAAAVAQLVDPTTGMILAGSVLALQVNAEVLA